MEQINIHNDIGIEANLKDLKGWKFEENKLRKEFKFKDFVESVTFLVKLSIFCELQENYPKIDLTYPIIVFEFKEELEKEVSYKDFLIIHEIERLYEER